MFQKRNVTLFPASIVKTYQLKNVEVYWIIHSISKIVDNFLCFYSRYTKKKMFPSWKGSLWDGPTRKMQKWGLDDLPLLLLTPHSLDVPKKKCTVVEKEVCELVPREECKGHYILYR